MKQFTLDEQAFLQDLAGLLRIRSVNGDCGPVSPFAPLGEGVSRAIDYMMAIGTRFGFRTKNVDGYCCWIEMGEGDEMAGILAHLDTVSVDDGWAAEPFGATLIDGCIYGRGVSDDKGPALLALYAMKAVADSGIKLTKRVRLILGGDEEGGAWRCMERYKQTEEIPACAFTPDAAYPTTYAEKGILRVRIFRTLGAGIMPLTLSCGKAINVVPAFASARTDGVLYTAEGRAAHAMEPHKGDNALLKLCRHISENGVKHPFIDLCAMADAGSLGIDFEDEASGRLTINPSIAKVDETSAELSCDIRVPVTVGTERVLEAIARAVAPLGFSVEETSYTPPLYVKRDSDLVQKLQEVYHACTGYDDPPAMTGGGTYARAFPNAVSFGALLPGDEITYHQTNERWKLSSMQKNLTIMANAVIALAQ